jgi:SPP1 gp7 family putative phage head morphogenesis protein
MERSWARPHPDLSAILYRETQLFHIGREVRNAEGESLKLQLEAGTSPSGLILPTAWMRKLWEGLITLCVDVALLGALRARQQVLTGRMPQAKFVAEQIPELAEGAYHYPEEGLNWYRDYSLRLAGIHQAAVLDRVKEVVSESISKGQALRETIGAMQGVLDGLSKSRLENIARTESGKIYEQAKWQEYDAEPEVVGYEYVAILDERTTEICRSRDGRKFPKDQIEGNLPPAHFQCRSTVVPVFTWETEAEWFEWNPVPDNAPPLLDGFGSTSMEIPKLTKPQAKIARRLTGTGKPRAARS